MPYSIRKSGNGYKVYNKNTGKTYSKKSMPKERAIKQMRAMYASVQEALGTKQLTIEEIANNIDESFEDGSMMKVAEPVHFATFDSLRKSSQGIEDVVSLIGDDSESDCDTATGCVSGNATETKENDIADMAEKNLNSICRNCESIKSNIDKLKPWMAHKLSIVYAYLNDIEESLSSED